MENFLSHFDFDNFSFFSVKKFNFSYIIQLVRQVWKSLFASFFLFQVDNDIYPHEPNQPSTILTFCNLKEYKKLQNQKSKEKIWKINHIMENIGKAFFFFLFADVYVGLMVYSNFKLFLPMIYYVNFWQRKVVSCVLRGVAFRSMLCSRECTSRVGSTLCVVRSTPSLQPAISPIWHHKGGIISSHIITRTMVISLVNTW